MFTVMNVLVTLLALVGGGNHAAPPQVVVPQHIVASTSIAATSSSKHFLDSVVLPEKKTPGFLESVRVPTSTATESPKPVQLSNDNHYINVNGDTVHSPAYTTDNAIPPGATARCRDGSYSFSENHRGTCSHHDGVATWL